MRRRREMLAHPAPSPPVPTNNGVDSKDELYRELWRACAGTPVYVPRHGEKVYYFPQGHLEQVAAYTRHQQDGHMEIPVFHLPSKILCRVMYVELKAETFTDEVFAQITLAPVRERDDLGLEEEENDGRPKIYSFSKTLTPSDTSTHGGFSIPKRHADDCFRPLDMTHQTPAQEIVAKDMHGFEWHFRHIYRGHPKRHLLTSGWSTFVTSKRLVSGDSCVFVSGENGEHRVGIRRAVNHSNAPQSSTLISGHSMQLGILTNISHAISSGTIFTVYYHPWMYPFEFVIPLKHYLNSTVPDYPIGTRVQKHYEVVEEPVRRYAGTIVGREDIDGIRWPGSEWRCLKVQWDTIVDAYNQPERVCPWWIEPSASTKEKHIPIILSPKRANILNERPLPGLGGFAMDGAVQNSAKPASQARRVDKDLQGQDYNGRCSAQPLQTPPSTDVMRPSEVSARGSQFGEESRNHLPFPMKDPIRKSLGRPMSLAHEDLSSSSLSSIGSEFRNENEVPFGKLGGCSKYKLFGVSLIDHKPELPSRQYDGINKFSSLISSPPMCVTSGKTCNKCRSVNNRTCTKVLKLGTALGRAVDLTRFRGYDELVAELDLMFDFGGSLIDGRSGWHVTCIDDDGDMMLLGDYPWQDFQGMVQKMIICPKDGVNNFNPSSSADPPAL
ncbi:hypothetical protein Fmac_006652 [Flemingia macrophylla]|uniref:Auxin response factor n=1 Tax=Flemingia macrophylla TaxID=520843 RepID=A0ABD1NB70_9FABA